MNRETLKLVFIFEDSNLIRLSQSLFATIFALLRFAHFV